MVSLCRVPTAPGKPGKTGLDLENLEKQGVLGQNPGKILQNLEKNFDLALKKPKSLNRKNIWKKYPAQGRGQLFYIILKQSLPKTIDNSKFIL